MFYVLFYNADHSDAKVYIKRSYSIKGVKKHSVIEKYDSINQLSLQYGDWKSFINNRILLLNDEIKGRKLDNSSINFNFDSKLSDDCNNLRNFGYLLLQSVYYDLDINSFLYHYKNEKKLKIQYSLNDIMRLLVFSRIIKPSSKLQTSLTINDYAEDFDFSLDNIYDALDLFNDFKEKFQLYLYKKASSIFPPSDTVVYYDVTNFYYEVEDENELIAYGVEKNHRPDPITSFGLFMDSNGLPIHYFAYRGNISESVQMLPNWESLRNNLDVNHYIVCADSGMNSADIKKFIQSCNDHFIFSQSILKLPKSLQDKVLNNTAWHTFKSGKKYKIVKMIKEALVHDNSATRKDGKIKTNLESMYIFIFDKKSRDFLLNKIDDRINRAKDIIRHPRKYDKVNSRDGKQYIKKVVYDKDGLVSVEQSSLELDYSLIDNDRKFAGYSAIVTDLFDMDVLQIIKIASRRFEIEDCFRQMKTGFSTRPVFVYKSEHIHAHFLTCYVALMIMKLLENHYLPKLTADKIFEIVRETYFFNQPESDIWSIARISIDGINAFNALGLETIMYKNFTNKTLNAAIAITKNKK